MSAAAAMSAAAVPSVAAAPASLQDLPDPVLAALLAAVDPWRLGGIVVRSRAGPHRDRWLAWFRSLLAPGTPVRRLPAHADDSRIAGGLDLAATLAAGRPVAERGILAETDGGVLVVPMAERLAPSLAARLGAVIDRGVIGGVVGGAGGPVSARLGLIALDEGADDDERLPAALAERMAFRIAVEGNEALRDCPLDAAAVERARGLFPRVQADDAILDALEGTALALGVGSLRASILALRAARAAAALDGASRVEPAHAAIAARLVFAPRATRLPVERPPAPPETTDPPPADEAPEPPSDPPDRDTSAEQPIGALADVVLAAAKTAIPAGLLDRLRVETLLRTRGASPGGAGARQAATRRGRPIGVRRGAPSAGIRLNVIETLRAAAPWQKLRARPPEVDPAGIRLAIRRDDLRITRFEQRTETTTIFVVDASGSLAASRLAEAKGAVELLLADCYVRRDEVALLAFRGQRTDLLLPPTRSLARAKRSLADLPGGGATPLARAIDAATALADQIRRRGRTPVIVFLTDGRANVARDGSTGRAQATEDALAGARGLAATGLRTLVVDAAMRPQSSAQALAAAMGAVYVPLPRADASALSHAVRVASPA